ncbi:hypothetical protein ACFOSV_01490 [Algoriphagus namhaensis]|uniref:Uncharacterized protein n=1 Tax=Algoriphagus namhaensis TaxID=915353 RepID=A0ABV8APN6_9BACT
MKNSKKSISFVDWIPSLEKVRIKENLGDVYFFDPNKIESNGFSWSRMGEDLKTLNAVYGELFDEVVVKGKNLVCYWPNLDFSPSQKYEISKSLKSSGVEMNLFLKEKRGVSETLSFSYSQMEDWKELVMTLIESLCEDLQSNECLEEVMTIKNETIQIEVIKLVEAGEVKFVYFLRESIVINQPQETYTEKVFDSFSSLVIDLLSTFQLSNFGYCFKMSEYEKLFYKEMLQGDAYDNLVLSWEKLLNQN